MLLIQLALTICFQIRKRPILCCCIHKLPSILSVSLHPRKKMTGANIVSGKSLSMFLFFHSCDQISLYTLIDSLLLSNPCDDSSFFFSLDVLCNVEKHCGLLGFKKKKNLMSYEFVCLGDEHGSDKNIHGDIVLSKVKAPNMFERAKEEFDAVIGVIHQHKSSRFVLFLNV